MNESSDRVPVGGASSARTDQILFPGSGLARDDLVRYYEQVAERMMPYVGRRPLSVVRCPQGVEGECFLEQHPGPEAPGIDKSLVVSHEGEVETLSYVDEPRGLVSEVQTGAVEFHVWNSRVEDVEHPDAMVFGLEPDASLGLDHVRQGARDLRAVLDDLSCASYLKTGGARGYHVVVPLLPDVSWEALGSVSQRIAEVMAERWPDRYTSKARKSARAGKIFVDWLRNLRAAASLAPYSLRVREGVRVSMPLDWEELDTVAPDGVALKDALARIKGEDPWAGYGSAGQSIGRADRLALLNLGDAAAQVGDDVV